MSFAPTLACIYCGCTDDHACIVPIEDFDSPAIRAAQERFLESVGALGQVKSATVACWWISKDPPVCSAPACVTRFRAARQFDESLGLQHDHSSAPGGN